MVRGINLKGSKTGNGVRVSKHEVAESDYMFVPQAYGDWTTYKLSTDKFSCINT